MTCAAEDQDDGQPSVRFDHVAQFALAEPTLSVVTTAGEAAASDDGEPRLALYCVQPGGIRQLLLDPALCQPSAPAHDELPCLAQSRKHATFRVEGRAGLIDKLESLQAARAAVLG